MTPPGGDDIPVLRIVFMGAAAFLGVLGRAARWVDETGNFSGKKALFELCTAPAIGIIAAAVGQYLQIDRLIIGGIAAFLGLVGPATIETIALKWVDARLGK